MTLNDVAMIDEILDGKKDVLEVSDEKSEELLAFKEDAFKSDPLNLSNELKDVDNKEQLNGDDEF